MKKCRLCVCFLVIAFSSFCNSCVLYNSVLHELQAAEERSGDVTASELESTLKADQIDRGSLKISLGITIRGGKVTTIDTLRAISNTVDMIEVYLSQMFQYWSWKNKSDKVEREISRPHTDKSD